MKRLFYILVPIFIITIAGCGGGGSTSSTSGTTPTITPSGGYVEMTWTAPTKNADGSDLDDLAGYKIHYGPLSGSYTGGTIEIDTIATTNYDIQSVCSGYCCFVVVAVDNAGNESAYSDELCTTL